MNRRLMMAQQEIDWLEGYRVNASYYSYGYTVSWLNKKTVRIKQAGFMSGAQTAGASFIGIANATTQMIYVLPNYNMANLKQGATYKLTLTVKEVLNNAATAENDTTFQMAMGKHMNWGFASASMKLSEIVVGTKLEVTKKYNGDIGGAAVHISKPIAFDFVFNVEFKEVSQ